MSDKLVMLLTFFFDFFLDFWFWLTQLTSFYNKICQSKILIFFLLISNLLLKPKSRYFPIPFYIFVPLWPVYWHSWSFVIPPEKYWNMFRFMFFSIELIQISINGYLMKIYEFYIKFTCFWKFLNFFFDQFW